jgi:hypothetical protein
LPTDRQHSLTEDLSGASPLKVRRAIRGSRVCVPEAPIQVPPPDGPGGASFL